MVQVGYTSEEYELSPRKIAVNELEILGSRSGGKQDTLDAIGFVKKKDWNSIVYKTFPLDEINDALKFFKEGKSLGRVVIVNK